MAAALSGHAAAAVRPAPEWLLAVQHTQAARVLHTADGRTLMAPGDHVLAQLPAGAPAATQYRIVRPQPGMGEQRLVQAFGLAQRLPDDGAPLALFHVTRATDAVRPGDWLLPLEPADDAR